MRNFIINVVESLTIFGFIFLGIGLIFMVFPLWVAKVNEWGKKNVFTDQGLVKRPRLVGGIFLALSVFSFALFAALK